MSDVTQILSQIKSGDGQAAEKILPLVYEKLRQLAVASMVQDTSGQTLQATASVHEAHIRLVDGDKAQHWETQVALRLGDRVTPEPNFRPIPGTLPASEGRVR